MTTQMTAQDVLELSKALQLFVERLIMARSKHGANLTQQQRAEAERYEGQILDFASTLNAQSLLTTLSMLDGELQVLKDCTAGIKEAAQRIANIKKGIALATKIVALGVESYAAIASGNVVAMIAAAGAVLDAVSGA